MRVPSLVQTCRQRTALWTSAPMVLMGSHEPSGPPAGFSGCTLDVDESVNTGPIHFERVAGFKSRNRVCPA